MNQTLLYVYSPEDKPYLQRLKALVGTASVFLMEDTSIVTFFQVEQYAKSKNCTGIFSSSSKFLCKCILDDEKPSLNNYAGSYFRRSNLEIVFIDPIAQLVSVPYGNFVTSRYLSKLVYPQNWNTWPEFSHTVPEPHEMEEVYNDFSKANLIAVDIETTKTNLAITSISYTAVFLDPVLRMRTIVMEMDSDFNLAWMRKLNSLPVTKVTQNGKYDCSYLLRYNAQLSNWYADTATAFHCWYAELPKDLAYLQSFFLRNGRYWKNMADGDKATRLEYNGRDTYATAIIWCEFLLQAPQWAITNYLQEFPLLYPCLLAEMTGMKRDMAELEIAKTDATNRISIKSKSLDTMLGVTNFNVNSPIQMKALLKILGCKDLESADEKNLNKAAFRHPLISRIIDTVLDIRGDRKLVSTYLTEGKEFNGRILYSLNPHGTDTGRLASKEHHFWCGLNIQNIPRGASVKRTLIADDGFRIAECDLEQAESRDTAYIAGDEALINAVTGTRDFHSVNASAFFGVPYDSIYDDSTKKTKDKALRDLAKRVNHGANYNMGPNVLVETMGLKAIYKAAATLNLPKFWTPKQIAEYLLSCFHKTYPSLQKIYYTGVIAEIKTTRMLTSKIPGGWTRYCFSNPETDKRALNAYVAHPPQSLNAMTLNKAFMKVFYEIAMDPKFSCNFRLLAQIHDSILFQFREGHEYLCEEVKSRMEIPVRVRGYDGKTRTFTVPAAVKSGKDGKGSFRWSEIE